MLFDDDNNQSPQPVNKSKSVINNNSSVLDYDLPQLTREEINQMIQELDTCPLKNAGTRVVMPVGDGSSGIMLIGEAPGAQEDKMGEPFVGASGKFLNNILLPSVGLSRQNIYLTNIVKCRPPENRDPTDQEKLAWTPVLIAEIAAMQPNLIICLGRHSLGFFDPKLKIGQVHGKVFEVPLFKNYTQKVLACYHPAVALYNGGMRETLVQDFAIVQNFLTNS
ncbi:MAG: type-4 uracil-DNA glycosylase [Patescibacteria group bacterium]